MSENYKDFLKTPIRTDRKPLQDLLPLSQPLRVLIDPCDICNFRCTYCFQSYDKDFKGSIMQRETFQLIIEQLKEFEAPINVVHLYGLGEPMLNQDLPDYVNALKVNNVAKEVAITSNGSRLTESYSERLINAGLDRLSISLNGIEDSHFEKNVGRKIKFEEIYKQIQYFYSIRKQCHLHVKINGDCFTESEKERFVLFFKDYCDTLNIDHVVNAWPSINVTENHEQNIYDREIQGEGICPQMFYELLIHTDGNVSPCCADYTYRKENLGNIKTQTLKEIWNGSKLFQIRIQALQREKIDYTVCNGCTYAICAATVNLLPY